MLNGRNEKNSERQLMAGLRQPTSVQTQIKLHYALRSR
jgi:hypothetical protein